LSTAESCTGGHIAHRITTVPGASDYFAGSIVSYDNRIKEKLLDVDKNSIEKFGAVSREVVEQMAINVARKLKTRCSIAVSGIMGPDGGTKENRLGRSGYAHYMRMNFSPVNTRLAAAVKKI